MIKKKLELDELFMTYQSLLSEIEQEYYIDYFQNDYSLSEMADNYDLSRAAIHKKLQVIEKKLLHYEECLQLSHVTNLIMDLEQSVIDEKTKDKLKEVLECLIN